MAEKIFYQIPFRASKLVRKQEGGASPRLTKADKCDLADSIRQNLRLLLMTPPNRVAGNLDYGCKIHWAHFGLNTRLMTEKNRNGDIFKMNIEQNIRNLIQEFEPRIEVKEIVVSINHAQAKKQQSFKQSELQNNILQVTVNVNAKIKEEYTFDGQDLFLEDVIPLL